MNYQEYILCAAIWYKELPLKRNIEGVLPVNCDKGIVITGHRHGQIIWTIGCLLGLRTVTNAEDGVGEHEQGFLTSKNRFVDREEALKIAIDFGQCQRVSYGKTQLFSEDLY